MKQRFSWKANRSSVTQNNSPHFMVPQSSSPHSQQPATCPHLNKIDPVPPHPPSPLRYILISPSNLSFGTQSDPLPSGFPTKTLYAPLLSPIRAKCPPIQSPWSDHPNGEKQHRALSSLLCSLLQSPVTSSILGPNILLCTLFSKTLCLHSSFNVSDQVSQPYKKPARL